jgi:hypothetical protein
MKAFLLGHPMRPSESGKTADLDSTLGVRNGYYLQEAAGSDHRRCGVAGSAWLV